MRAIHRCILALLAAGATGVAARPADDQPPAADEFFGVWIEERRESGGKVYTQPGDLLGWDLTRDDSGCWLRRGESVYTHLGRVRIRTDKEPAWLDLVGEDQDGKVYIRPGIARREDQKLVWVWAKDWRPADPRDIDDYSDRPQSLELKNDDPWEKKTLYRSAERYAQD